MSDQNIMDEFERMLENMNLTEEKKVYLSSFPTRNYYILPFLHCLPEIVSKSVKETGTIFGNQMLVFSYYIYTDSCVKTRLHNIHRMEVFQTICSQTYIKY